MSDFFILLPEGTLLFTALALFLGETTYFGEKTRPTLLTAMLGLTAATVQAVLGYRLGVVSGFQRTVVSDGLGLFLRITEYLLAAWALIAVHRASEFKQHRIAAEISAFVLLLTAAVSLAVGATHLGTIWILLALVAALGAVLIGSGRGTPFSAEGGIKLLPFGGLALLFFAFGSALLFVRTGTLHLFELQKLSAFSLFNVQQQGVIFSLFFFSLGILVGIFPFQAWAVDSIHGTPAAIAGFVQLSFRLAATAVFMRVIIGIFSQTVSPGVWSLAGESSFSWPTLLGGVFAVSALWLSLLAMQQQRLRRLLAALGGAQVAQIWAGFLVLDETGFTAALFGSVVLGFGLLGCFVLTAWFSDFRKSDRYADLAGALWVSPLESAALGVFLLYLAGIPPLPGFVAQFALLSSVLRADRAAVAAALIAAWIFSAIAVSRALFALWGPHRAALQAANDNAPRESRTLLLALSLPLILFTLGAQWLFQFASRSLELILW